MRGIRNNNNTVYIYFCASYLLNWIPGVCKRDQQYLVVYIIEYFGDIGKGFVYGDGTDLLTI